MQSTSQIETVQSPEPKRVYARCPEGIMWRWDVEQIQDGDGFYRNCHMAVSRNGKKRFLDWSGFQQYNDDHFIHYVTAGFPAHQKQPPYHPCLPDCIEKMDGFKTEIDQC